MDKTSFILHEGKDIIIAQVYVDDFVFGSTSSRPTKKFNTLMQNEFEMSMMSELSFFLGLQIR